MGKCPRRTFSSNRTSIAGQSDKSLRALSNDNVKLMTYRWEHVLTELFLSNNRDSMQPRITFPQLIQEIENMLKALPLTELEIVIMLDALSRTGQAM